MSFWSKILGAGEPGKPWECTITNADGTEDKMSFFAVDGRAALSLAHSMMPMRKDTTPILIQLEPRLDWEGK